MYILHLPISSKSVQTLRDFISPKVNTNERHKVVVKPQYKIEKNLNIINFDKNSDLMNKINSYKNNTTGFRFKDKNIWPRKTDIACWHCTYEFDTTPCSIPYKVQSIPYKKNNKEYLVYGSFCSFNCAKAYLLITYTNEKWEKLSYLNQLYFNIYNEYIDIHSAPPKEVLIKYGGQLTIDEFRKYNNYINCNILIPPITSICPEIDINVIRKIFNKDTPDMNFTRARSKTGLRIKKKVVESEVKEDEFMKYFS